MERNGRDDSVPADRDIDEICYNTDSHTLSVNYHRQATRIMFASRQYLKLVQGDGGDDDVEWNTRHHTAFQVIVLCIPPFTLLSVIITVSVSVRRVSASYKMANVLHEVQTSCGARHNKPRPLLPPSE